MATAAATSSARWHLSEYAFDPYKLMAERVDPVDLDIKLAQCDGKKEEGPIKRRPGRQKRTSVLCQVPGCNAELVDAKKYYRRYRICMLHCNMPAMVIEGRRQRFCQQCGRFHDIGEFEGAKRSCKRKLKRHNERRRSMLSAGAKKKWQSDSEMEEEQEEDEDADLYESSDNEGKKVAASSAKRHGSRLPIRRQPQRQAVAAAEAPASGDSSAASHSTEAGGAVAPQLCAASLVNVPAQQGQAPQLSQTRRLSASMSGSLDSSSQGGAGGGTAAPQANIWAAPAAPGAAHLAALPAGPNLDSVHLAQVKPEPVQELEMPAAAKHAAVHGGTAAPAASALAAMPVPASNHSSGVDLDTVLQQLLHDDELQDLPLDPLEVDAAQILLPEQPAGSCQHAGIKAEFASQSVQLEVPHPPPIWGHEQFPSVLDVPLELLADIPMLPLPEDMDGTGVMPSLVAPAFMTATGSAGSAGTAVSNAPCTSAAASDTVVVPGMAGNVWQEAWGVAGSGAAASAPSQQTRQQQQLVTTGVQSGTLASARSMLSTPSLVNAATSSAPLVGYSNSKTQQHQLTCLSLKVFGCTPEGLLPAVRQELEELLQVGQTLLEGYIRPGCTQLTLNALMSRNRVADLKAAGLGRVVDDLLSKCSDSEVLDKDMLIQFEGEMAVVKQRKVVALISLKNSPALVPSLGPLLPLAVCATASAPACPWLLLRGRHLCGDTDLVLARQQGTNLTVEMHACGEVQSGEYAKVRILGLMPGSADLEVQHGTFISRPRTLLVLPSQAAVNEVRQLEHGAPGVEDVDDLLRDIGLVVQYLHRQELEAAGQPCPPYTPTLLLCIAAKARRLVAAAVARRWEATTELLLPAIMADGKSATEAVAGMNVCCPPGMTLLHVAVGTGSVPVVQRLAAWGRANGYSWQVDAHGTAGVTPLHVAALLPNCTAMQAVLAGVAPAATKLWGLAQADDGSTPEALAEAVQAAATAAAMSLAAKDVVAPSPAAAGTCNDTGAAAELVTAGKPSGSKTACSSDEIVASQLSNTSQAPSLSERIVEATKNKGAEEEGCPPCYGNQWRRGRLAMKQHLDDMHMTTILSEVVSGLEGSDARDPRPLADALNGTLAAGAAFLRALGYNRQ